jgi:hypothetical protein
MSQVTFSGADDSGPDRSIRAEEGRRRLNKLSKKVASRKIVS